uniref:Uncharacterized protein n=1 Tax=Cacopsylla melanoneura TaxID=428564 RepID=A0A8D9A6T0_9HEMI
MKIQMNTATQFLGITIDQKLTFLDHINSINKKINSACYLMIQLRNKISFKALKSVYYAYIHSTILYGIILWGNSPHAKQVFVNQKRAIRILTRKSYRTSCKDIFKEQNIITLPGLYILEILKYVKREPENFPLLGPFPTYQTRFRLNNEKTVVVEPHATSFYEKSVQYNGTKLFNMLPLGLREMEPKRFASLIKDYVTTKSFYSIEEFAEDIKK